MKYSIIALVVYVVAAVSSASAQTAAVPFGKASGSSVSSTASTTGGLGLHERNPRYRLRKGDTFDLDFALSPEFNQTVAVQPDGYITLKSIGSLFVEGQTVPELTETVKTVYAKTLHDPVVVIALKDFEKPYFIASGQVSKPGKYDLRSDLTVTEAVAIAGGFNGQAKHSQVVLFRPVPSGGFDAKLLNVKKLLASRNLSEDVQLQPGDMLYVPQNAFSKIKPFIPTANMGAYYNPAGY
jgi:polysaccharide export outer membrane protein